MSTSSAIYGLVHTTLSNFFVRLPVPQKHGDISQQVFIVTGSNTGLGLETSRHLLRLGAAKLIMGVRNLDKGELARQDLLKTTGRTEHSIEVWPLDMDSYESVKAFARRASDLPRLDGVLANAGLATNKFSISEENEKTLTVNFISTFLLFFLLLRKMRESEQLTSIPCRFVIPNSALHYVAPTKELFPTRHIFERLNDPKEANMTGRYALSKLLVLWVVREIAEQCSPTVILNTPNPSFCQSELMREHDNAAIRLATKILARTTEQGSRTLYHGLIAGRESHGQYLTNCHIQSPARHVIDKNGQQIQRAIYDELREKLEAIQPGVTAGLKKATNENR